MADKKISELTELPQAEVADADEYVLVDKSATENKKFTWASIKGALQSFFSDLFASKPHGNTEHTSTFITGAEVPANETDPNVDSSLKGITLTQVRDHDPKAHKTSHAEGGSDPLTEADIGVIGAIAFIIDGGGSAITTGQKGHLEIPFKCEIQQVTLLADQTGSIVIDIWKDTYANFPPTSADSICGSAKPTISSAQKYQDATLTGWTKTINAGDILAFNVDSAATITRVTLALKIKKIA
jgi:hypothetical protein